MKLSISYAPAIVLCVIRVHGSRDSANTNTDESRSPDNSMTREFVPLSEELNLQEPGVRRDYSAYADSDSTSSGDSIKTILPLVKRPPVYSQRSASTEPVINRDSPENRSMLSAWRTAHITQEKKEPMYDSRDETTGYDTVQDFSGALCSGGTDEYEEPPSSGREILMTRSYPHGLLMGIHASSVFKPFQPKRTTGGEKIAPIAPQPRRVQLVRQVRLEHEYDPQEETEQSVDTVYDISSDLCCGGREESPEQASNSRGIRVTRADQQRSQWTLPTTMGFKPIDPAQTSHGRTIPPSAPEPDAQEANRPRQPPREPEEHDQTT